MTARKNKLVTSICIQRLSRLKTIPRNNAIKLWITTALHFCKCHQAEIVIRIVNNRESGELNQTYRQKTGPTNVLSFVYDTAPLFGDIVLCAPLIAQQAKQRKLLLAQHWAHLIVHGVLHLLDYDHQTPREAKVMEKHETTILRQLGFNNPY